MNPSRISGRDTLTPSPSDTIHGLTSIGDDAPGRTGTLRISVPVPPGGATASGGHVRASMRTYSSSRFLWTAFHSCDKALAIEAALRGQSRFDIEQNSYVLSAIASSVAFLEAAVNEFFEDASDGHGLTDDGYLAPLNESTVEGMKSMWRESQSGRQIPCLRKWQRLRDHAGLDWLKEGESPFLDASLLVVLRNELVHFRPESVFFGQKHDMERKFRGRFTDNPLFEGSENPWWPGHCLGSGCAFWAAHSALSFADRVCNDLGVSPNYQRVASSGWFGKTPASWQALWPDQEPSHPWSAGA